MYSLLDYLRKRPIIIAAIGCSVTAVCGYYSKYLLGAVLVLIIPYIMWALLNKRLKSVIILLMIFTVALSCAGGIIKIGKAASLEGKKVVCEFVVLENTYEGDDFSLSNIEITHEGVLSGADKISLIHKPWELEMGEKLIGEITVNKATENFKNYSYSSGVYITGTLEDIIEKKGEDEILSLIRGLRKHIKNSLFEEMSLDSAVTVSALIFGDKSNFSDQYYGNVKAAGVAHVMVVSGMHLSIIITMLLKFGERFIYNSALRAVIMLFTVILVCGVCGFTMSILRAGITYIIMALGLILKRDYSGENALALAVVIILTDTPFAIMNVGFLLSVLSTFGILAVALPICRYIKASNLKLGKFCLNILQSAIISLSALLLTLPVCIAAFRSVSTVAVITNLLFSLPVNACLCISVIGLAAKPILPFVATVLLKVSDYITRYVNSVINYLGEQKYSSVETPVWLSGLAVLLILAVFYMLGACKKRIDVLKLKALNKKILKERGRAFKWQLFLKKH